jgi:hypothetical protein
LPIFFIYQPVPLSILLGRERGERGGEGGGMLKKIRRRKWWSIVTNLLFVK